MKLRHNRRAIPNVNELNDVNLVFEISYVNDHFPNNLSVSVAQCLGNEVT